MISKNIARRIRLYLHRVMWKKRNKHNNTYAVSYFHIENVKVGIQTYGPIEILYDSGNSKVCIGNYCSIAQNTKILVGGVHEYKRITTFPFQTLVYHGYSTKDDFIKYDVVVEDDVWIGYDVIILPGTRIGKGSVIGAGAVCTGYIPPYSVYVGNKVIKRRFSERQIDILSKIDFSKIRHSVGDVYQNYCDTVVDDNNIEEIMEAFTLVSK